MPGWPWLLRLYTVSCDAPGLADSEVSPRSTATPGVYSHHELVSAAGNLPPPRPSHVRMWVELEGRGRARRRKGMRTPLALPRTRVSTAP